MSVWQNEEHEPHKRPLRLELHLASIYAQTETSCTVINFPDTMWDSLQLIKPNTYLHIFRTRTYLALVCCDLMSILNLQLTKC